MPGTLGTTHASAGPLADAVFWIDAARSKISNGKMQNLGWGGSALDAQFGSTTPSASFDGSALVLPGVAGNNAFTPDAPAISITGDIEIVVRVALDDWTPAAQSCLVGKLGGVGDRGYAFYVTPGGFLKFDWSTDGTTIPTATSTVALGGVNATTYWVKLTRSTAGTVTSYWAIDQPTEPASWTQLGTPVASTAGSIFDSTSILTIGDRNGVDSSAGKFYRTIIRNGINGVTVFDADFARPFDTTSFTPAIGGTVTLTRTTTGVDTNDPTVLSHTGTSYMYLPGAGAAANYASIPDAANLDITGDIEIVNRLSAADWTPTTAQGAINSRQTLVDPDRAWQVRHLAGGTLGFHWYPAGTGASVIVANSTVPAPWADGTTVWLKVTMDVNNGAGGNDVRFWYAADQPTEPTSWTQLGATVTTAGVTSLPNVTSPLYVGLTDGTTTFLGNIYRTIIRNGIGGSTVVDIDFTRLSTGAETTFTATTGQTVTINRAATGRVAVGVVRPVVILGGDDYFEVPDSPLLNFGASEAFTVLAIYRPWRGHGGRVISKQSGSDDINVGWRTQVSAAGADLRTRMFVGDGVTATNISSSGTFATGSLVSAVFTRSAAGSFSAYKGSATGTVVAPGDEPDSLSNALPLRIGNSSAGTSQFADMEFFAAAIVRRALTAAEVAAWNAYYGTA
jgi:hypothetical protein